MNGYWQGSTKFNYPNASFSLSVTNADVNLQAYGINNYSPGMGSYEFIMENLYENLKKSGEYSLNQNLGYNILFWMTRVITLRGLLKTDTDPPVRFTLNGDALVVFNRNTQIAGISNSTSFCEVYPSVLFSSYDGVFTVSYNGQLINNNNNDNQVCLDLIGKSGGASLVNQAKTNQAQSVEIDYDIRSLVTAMAVNSGINNLKDLVLVSNQNYYYSNLSFNKYYDPKYIGMSAILCTNNINPDPYGKAVALCLLPVGNLLGFPILNHVGDYQFYPSPSPCVCNSKSYSNYTFLCNQLQFINGIVYFNSQNLPYQNNQIIKLTQNYILKYGSEQGKALQQLNNDAYNASFELFDSSNVKSLYYSFCNSACKIFAILSVDDIDDNTAEFQIYDSSISKYYYSLTNGACSASYVPTEDAWKRLSKTPFTPLFHPYQECVKSVPTAVINNLGIGCFIFVNSLLLSLIGMGNVSLFSLPLFIILLFCVFVCYKSWGISHEGDYSRLERQQATDALAQLLLLSKDKKINSNDDDIIDRIIKKLREHNDVIDEHVNPKRLSSKRNSKHLSTGSHNSVSKRRSSKVVNNPILKDNDNSYNMKTEKSVIELSSSSKVEEKA